MNAKRYLSEIRRLDIICRQKREEINLIREQATCVPALTIKQDLVQTSPDGQGFTRLMDRAADLEAELKRDLEQLQEERHRRVVQIQQLENPLYIDILYQRYVYSRSLQYIAEDTGMSYERIRHYHGDALYEFSKMFLQKRKS